LPELRESAQREAAFYVGHHAGVDLCLEHRDADDRIFGDQVLAGHSISEIPGYKYEVDRDRCDSAYGHFHYCDILVGYRVDAKFHSIFRE
jgi:hypothetical protein